MSTGDQAIRDALGSPELRPLFSAVRQRVERGGRTPRSATIRDLSRGQGQAVASLLGLAVPPTAPYRVDLERLDRCLRESRLGVGLRRVLEALGGPLRDHATERAAARQRESNLWERAEQHPTVQEHPELRAWLHHLRDHGLLRRAVGREDSPSRSGATNDAWHAQAELLEQALEVAQRLASPRRRMALSVLAAEATGDAHALDPDRPLCGIVLHAAARLAGREELPRTTRGRRQLWAEVGVACDPLSTHALTLGLRVDGDPLLVALLGACAEAGEPIRLTLRQLSRGPLRVGQGTRVFVCENPTVVAVAADELGWRCPPLVCLEGVPSTAVDRLLRLIVAAGASLLFHCDFDWPGLRIGAQLAARHGARPWRFSATDYEGALAAGVARHALSGRPAHADWDPALSPAMRRQGHAVHEEQVVEHLLDDLRQASA